MVESKNLIEKTLNQNWREFLFDNPQIVSMSQGLILQVSYIELGNPHETRIYLFDQTKIHIQTYYWILFKLLRAPPLHRVSLFLVLAMHSLLSLSLSLSLFFFFLGYFSTCWSLYLFWSLQFIVIEGAIASLLFSIDD